MVFIFIFSLAVLIMHLFFNLMYIEAIVHLMGIRKASSGI